MYTALRALQLDRQQINHRRFHPCRSFNHFLHLFQLLIEFLQKNPFLDACDDNNDSHFIVARADLSESDSRNFLHALYLSDCYCLCCPFILTLSGFVWFWNRFCFG